jgi:hypothetical protein
MTLGPVTLVLRLDRQLEADDFLDHLAETRTGIYGKIAVGTPRTAETLDDLRRAMGHTV